MDFAPHFTARIRLTYRGALLTHKQTWRVFLPGGSSEEPMEMIYRYYNSIETLLFSDFQILGAELALQGSDLFTPIGLPDSFENITPSAAPPLPGDRPQYFSIPGRSTLGHRAIIFQYGATLGGDTGTANVGNDYRITGAELSVVQNAVNQLNQEGFVLRANDGAPVIWKSYFNLGYNSHLTKKARG